MKSFAIAALAATAFAKKPADQKAMIGTNIGGW